MLTKLAFAIAAMATNFAIVQIGATCAGSGWTGERTLNAEAEYTIKYKVTGEDLVIRLHAKTNGFLGFGFSEAGHMMGSDIVTAAIVDGVPRLEDRFSEWEAFPLDFSIPEPKEDKCQHWSVLCASEQGQFTEFILTRPMNTADTEDRVVQTGSVIVIFAWGFTDTVAYHFGNRGSTSIDFFSAANVADFAPPADATSSVELLLNNYSMGTGETQYILQRYEIEATTHIVAIEPVIKPEDSAYAHHILLHDCGPTDELILGSLRISTFLPLGNASDPATNPAIGRGVSPLGLGPCKSMIFGWALGGGPVTYPMGTGVRTGSTAAKHIIIEFHLNNIKGDAGKVITSGVRLHMTNNLREHNLGTIVLGNAGAGMAALEKGQARIHRESTCPEACTTKWKGPIRLVRSFPHMHNFGREMWTTKYSNDGTSTIISSKQFWNFGFQTQTELNIEIQNGTDRLSTHCVYDTTKAASNVTFGASSNQEMCMDFVMYYPKENAGIFCGRTNSGTNTVCLGSQLNPALPNPSPDGQTTVAVEVAVGNVPAVCQLLRTSFAGPPSKVLSAAMFIAIACMSLLL